MLAHFTQVAGLQLPLSTLLATAQQAVHTPSAAWLMAPYVAFTKGCSTRQASKRICTEERGTLYMMQSARGGRQWSPFRYAALQGGRCGRREQRQDSGGRGWAALSDPGQPK